MDGSERYVFSSKSLNWADPSKIWELLTAIFPMRSPCFPHLGCFISLCSVYYRAPISTLIDGNIHITYDAKEPRFRVHALFNQSTLTCPNHWTQLYTTDIVYYLVNVADNIWTSPTISEFSSVDLLPPIYLGWIKVLHSIEQPSKSPPREVRWVPGGFLSRTFSGCFWEGTPK